MFKVKNETSEPKKFRDAYLGRDVILGPGESIDVIKAPVEHPSFSIKELKGKKSTKNEDKTE